MDAFSLCLTFSPFLRGKPRHQQHLEPFFRRGGDKSDGDVINDTWFMNPADPRHKSILLINIKDVFGGLGIEYQEVCCLVKVEFKETE